MTISVIVPLYNARAYVGAALESILGQSRPPEEIIVVDDGSTDGSSGVVAGYGPKVRLLTQEHRGPATALNCGLRAATGETIAFLDADDLWLREKLALQVPVLATDPSLDGVFGHLVQLLDEDATSAGRRFVVSDKPMVGTNRTTLLVRRAALDRLGWFDETLGTSEFVPWFSRAAALGFRYRVMDDVVARRRIHLGNTGVLRRHDQQQESLLGLRQALALRRRKNAEPG